MKPICNYIIPSIFLAIILTLILSANGCGRKSICNESLDVAETLMESRPDSALSILDSINPSHLATSSQKARYALLKSMALDKNYVDATDFDVLQPAIDYYLKNGNPDEKLRTYYYQGRIYQNRNDRDSALQSFSRGLDVVNEAHDSLTIARTLVAQGLIYKEFYDINAYADNFFKAAGIFKKHNREREEFECLTNALNGKMIVKDREASDSIMSILGKIDSLDNKQQKILQRYRLGYTFNFGSTQDIKDFLDNKASGMLYDASSMLGLARAYNRVGDNNSAIQLFDYIDKKGIEYDTLRYLSIKFQVLEDKKEYEKALETYKDFVVRLETMNSTKFEQKSLSLKRLHEVELSAEIDKREHIKSTWRWIASMGALVFIIIIMVILIRSSKLQRQLAIQEVRTTKLENEQLKYESEKLSLANRNLQLEQDKKSLELENLSHRVEELETESANLKILLESQDEIPAEVRKAIQVRIEMLNTYIAGQITNNDKFGKAYDAWVGELTANTEEFMNSNRLAFQASHPSFIKYFEDHGLTPNEINYVCLYAIGLKGKEVGNYMKKRGHVNLSSTIRKKLGILKYDTNIGTYVRKLLKNL